MKIVCEFGYYKFYPETPNELVVFSDTYGVELVKVEDYYTYPTLASLPDYSIKGQLYGGKEAIINFAGKPWQVFEQNKLNYDTESDKIISNDIKGIVGETETNYLWVVVGIPPAYSELANKKVITGFEGWLNVVENYTIITGWQNANI